MPSVGPFVLFRRTLLMPAVLAPAEPRCAGALLCGSAGSLSLLPLLSIDTVLSIFSVPFLSSEMVESSWAFEERRRSADGASAF